MQLFSTCTYALLLGSAGPELEGSDTDYLCTTPPQLANTIDNILALFDSSRGRGTMAGDAASLMNPEVIAQWLAGLACCGVGGWMEL